MKIHTDNMIAGDIGSCVPEGTRIVEFSEATSRSHDRAYIVRLRGSARGTMRNLPYKAATYDEWGIFLSLMFSLDPSAKIGPYDGIENFQRMTAHQFTVEV